jgi:hypothetical protein
MQQRHIAFQMPTARDEHRQHENPLRAFGDQRFGTGTQIGGQELEESEFDAQLRCLRAHRHTDPAHRFGPFGVASAMGKKDQSGR